jgi:tRNA A-37 threonylcarbamoyl transferase component Bud32
VEQDGGLISSKSYLKISGTFIRKAERTRIRFVNLLKTGHRALFLSLVGMLPQMMSSFSQGTQSEFNLQRVLDGLRRHSLPVDDPYNYVYVRTSTGLVSLANRVDIEGFARKIFKTGEDKQMKISSLGGILNDVYLVSTCVDGKEKRIVAKRFRDWSNFKWFPITLWSLGTRSFAVLGRSRLEREYAINRLLHSEGFKVPEVYYVSPNERLVFMEFVVGEDLSNAIKRIADAENVDGLSEDLQIIAKVGTLLAKVHALGVSIGDSKPENIIIDEKGELCLTDLEQAARGGDKTWDIAEFLYYSGHYFSPLVDPNKVEKLADAFLSSYLHAGGNPNLVRKAANAKYTKVFSIFTFPNITLTLSNICRRI